MQKLFVASAIGALLVIGCGSQNEPDKNTDSPISPKETTNVQIKAKDKANQIIKYLDKISKKRNDESDETFKYYEAIALDLESVESAAENGNSSAMYALGIAYFFGKGVVKSDVESAKWFLKAARLGNVDAQADIGHRYAIGLGVVKNEKEEIDWYRKAIKQGSPEAMLYLAWNYSKGKVVDKDIERAYSLYLLARDQGKVKAKEHIEELEKVMTEKQIIDAKALYYGCLSSYMDNCG